MRRRFNFQFGKTALSMGLVATLIVLLSACDPAPAPPRWAARVIDGTVEIAFCEPLEATELGADVEQQTGERWKEFWKATGTIVAQTGDTLRLGAKGLGIVNEDVDLQAVSGGSTILVFAYRGQSQIERAWFEFATTTPDRQWAHPGADPTAEPCSQ